MITEAKVNDAGAKVAIPGEIRMAESRWVVGADIANQGGQTWRMGVGICCDACWRLIRMGRIFREPRATN